MDRQSRPVSSVRPAADEVSQPRVKRPRAAQACERCRRKKYKCDELHPCSQCSKGQLECVYQGTYYRERNRSASYTRDLEKRVDELTTQLRRIDRTATSRQLPPQQDSPPGQIDVENGPIFPSAIRPTPMSMPGSEPSQDNGGFLSSNDNDEHTDTIEGEISEVNQHTNGIEFHGNTSSVAFLGYLQKARRPSQLEVRMNRGARDDRSSLISTLHNSGFSPQAASILGPSVLSADQDFYIEQAHVFMDGYFENIHFIHPLIDKEYFVSRAHDLIFGRVRQPETSFLALYFSLLSLGALVRVWDEARLAGLTRFQWSRKLFGEAQACLNGLRFSNDLDTVQCLYLMAKICQNELNPHLAYMYLGLAIRTCLSAGFNRENPNPKNQRSTWISKTWWGIYSLEVEMSFSLGRPDTLGMDEYHNRSLPERDDSESAIIPHMVDFARIIRRVSVEIYHLKYSMDDKMQRALLIEKHLDDWLVSLPDRIRPNLSGEPTSLRMLQEPKWCRRQRLVLTIRYHNVKMVLFRHFLLYFSRKPRPSMTFWQDAINKCLDSAKKTIEVIHETFRLHTFFRFWWYNTTYIMFATSILLLHISKLGLSSETIPLLKTAEMSVEIVEAMDESVVAKKSAEIIRHTLAELQDQSTESESMLSDCFFPSPLADSGFLPSELDVPGLSHEFRFLDYSFGGALTDLSTGNGSQFSLNK